jgi:hypothetical protein
MSVGLCTYKLDVEQSRLVPVLYQSETNTSPLYLAPPPVPSPFHHQLSRQWLEKSIY